MMLAGQSRYTSGFPRSCQPPTAIPARQLVVTILSQDPTVATGAGHHSVVQLIGSDEYAIVYHRRPLGLTDANHRVVCIDRLTFDDQGRIEPVRITFRGVPAGR